MSSELIVTFICACVALLVLICGFFVKTWITSLMETINKLSQSVEHLTTATSDLKASQALERLRTRQLLMEVRNLQAESCTMEDCPSKQTSPGVKHFVPRTRLDDFLSDPHLGDEGEEGLA